jgi:hypothetical protein
MGTIRLGFIYHKFDMCQHNLHLFHKKNEWIFEKTGFLGIKSGLFFENWIEFWVKLIFIPMTYERTVRYLFRAPKICFNFFFGSTLVISSNQRIKKHVF